VQITLGGWDNHQNIYAANAGIYPSARQLDTGLANLIADLSIIPGSNGKTMLDETLIVVKGEFGRTVGNITSQQGRDHYFVHSTLIAGGGVRGGRALGKTTADGAFVEEPGWSEDRPVYAEDIAATIYSALGINYTTTRHDDPLGRGFEYIPSTGSYVGTPVVELFY
jgi:uncharacterized protein (DUF1501 family)